MLAKATDRLESGDLLSPSNDNARYYFQLVLTNDTDNAAARQGLGLIAGKLAFQARTEIDNGDLSLASDTLANARALDPTSGEVAAAAEALENKRAEIVRQERLDEDADRQALANQQAAAERTAEAERVAAAEQQAETERLAREQSLNNTDGQIASASPEPPTTSGSDSAGGVIGSTSVALAANAEAKTEMPADKPLQEQPQSILDQQPTSISSLNRTKYSAPKYPRSAQRRNQSGWVDVVFTVTTDGTVKDVDVRKSEPGETFDSAAIKAVEKWEFEPVVESGVIVEKRAGVRLMFALE